MLSKHNTAFAWDYVDMKGIHSEIFQHRIYIKDDATPIRQPQIRMNLARRDIGKEEQEESENTVS